MKHIVVGQWLQDDESLEEPAREIVLPEAQNIDPELNVGDVIEEKIECLTLVELLHNKQSK